MVRWVEETFHPHWRVRLKADGTLVASAAVAGEARFERKPMRAVPGALASDLLEWLGRDPRVLWRVESEDETFFLHGLGTVSGMVLHACHNTVLVLLGVYADRVPDLGWNIDQDHAPVLWLAAAAVSVAAGAVLVAMGRPATIRAASAAIQ